MLDLTKAKWLSLLVFLFVATFTFAQQDRSEVWSATIYPNPSQGIVHVELSGKYDEYTHINIIDANGRSVYTEDVINDEIHRIDLRSVPKGTYIMQMTSTNVYMKQTLIIR